MFITLISTISYLLEICQLQVTIQLIPLLESSLPAAVRRFFRVRAMAATSCHGPHSKKVACRRRRREKRALLIPWGNKHVQEILPCTNAPTQSLCERSRFWRLCPQNLLLSHKGSAAKPLCTGGIAPNGLILVYLAIA